VEELAVSSKAVAGRDMRLLSEKGLQSAVRPEFEKGRSARLVVFFRPTHGVGCEATGGGDDETAYQRRFPQLDRGDGVRHFCGTNGS
jgi:hypothetical protein